MGDFPWRNAAEEVDRRMRECPVQIYAVDTSKPSVMVTGAGAATERLSGVFKALLHAALEPGGDDLRCMEEAVARARRTLSDEDVLAAVAAGVRVLLRDTRTCAQADS